MDHMDTTPIAVADLGFLVGSANPRRGAPTLILLSFEEFVCQNERIGTLRGVRRGEPLYPPMHPLLSRWHPYSLPTPTALTRSVSPYKATRIMLVLKKHYICNCNRN